MNDACGLRVIFVEQSLDGVREVENFTFLAGFYCDLLHVSTQAGVDFFLSQ